MQNFCYNKLEALHLPSGIHPQIIDQDVGIHAGGEGNKFSITVATMNVLESTVS